MGNTGSSIVVGRTQAIQRVECIIYDLLKEDGSGVDCDNIRKHKDVIEKIVGHVVVTKEELKLFSTRISKKMVLFPFIGEGSCGKSTLINALLGDRYLPFSCSKETATRIYIMAAAENLQEPPCLYKSLERSEETVVARGVAKIHEAIRKFNEDSQNNLEVPEILLIYTKIPFFESAQRDTSLNPIIMDCPGIEDVMKDMQQYLNVVSGVIYVHNYERFLQNHERIREDLQRMKQMKIIFVTSRFDAYYSVFTGDNPDKTKVKQKVTEAFRDLVKEENVIPVSGRWALCSKLYNDRQARHVVDQAMSDLKLNNHSNATECNHEEVMKFSNILELEKRLKNFLDEVDQNNWHSEVVTICDGFLKRFIQVGKRCEQDLLRKKDDQDKHVEIASRTIKGIRNVSWKSSETLEEEFKNHVKDGASYYTFFDHACTKV